MSKKNFTDYYRKEEVTGTYDAQREGTEYRREKRKKELQIFLDLLDKKEGEEVLELGCSSGFFTQHLGKVTAIDTSTDMLKITRKKNPKATVLSADMFNLPFGKDSFDKVVTMRVWTHLNESDLKKVVIEARRVLKQGGYIVFDLEEASIVRAVANFIYKKFYKITGYKIYRYKDVKVNKILNDLGFFVERIEFMNHKVGRQIFFKASKN